MKPSVIELIKNNQDKIRFLLDSGAFTAWKAGKVISVDDYCRFIESLPFKPWRYFTLDVIGNPEATLKNYNTMLERGFKPIPIFTRGEDIKMIDEYYKTSDVVAIGGLVGTKNNQGFVKGIMNVIGNRKCHWLGFVRHELVNRYKPYMIDSSSWSHASRNGDLKVYTGNGKIKSYRRKDFISRPSLEILRILKTFDISIEQIASTKFWDSWKCLNSAAARMWVRRSLESERKIKCHLFLACANDVDVSLLLEAYHKEVKWTKQQ